MPPPLHREKTGAAAARLGLAALLLVAGVILALGPGSAALAGRVARAAEAASPASTPRGPGPPKARSAVGASRGEERVPPLRMPLAGPIVRGSRRRREPMDRATGGWTSVVGWGRRSGRRLVAGWSSPGPWPGSPGSACWSLPG
jgi:hypothetical protein